MSLLNTAGASTLTDGTPSSSIPTSTPAFLTSLLATQQSFHASLVTRHPTVWLPPLNLYLLSLHTAVRATTTQPAHFAPLLNRLIGILLDHCLTLLPFTPSSCPTPTGHAFDGCTVSGRILAVSVMRAGEAFEQPLRERMADVMVGKLLIQRDEASPTKQANIFYSKLPNTTTTSTLGPQQPHDQLTVLLCDVMLATGNSLCVAIDHLLGKGYELRQIIVLTLIGCPEGVEQVTSRFPGVRLCCQWVDGGLNEHKYIVPGVGDAGDRYFNTVTK